MKIAVEKIENNKNNIIFGFEPDNSSNYQLTDAVLGGQADSFSREMLVISSINWILKNKSKYNVPKGKCTDIMRRLEAVSKNKSDIGVYDAWLDDFSECFLNNPYIYEKVPSFSRSGNSITSRHISCYLVDHKGIRIPIGMLKNFFGEDVYRRTISAFMEYKNSEFYNIIKRNHNLCVKYSAGKVTERKLRNSFIIKTILGAISIRLSVRYIFKRLITGVDWMSIPLLYRQTDNLLHTIGFATENGYGINHNSTLNIVLLVLAILWLCTMLFYLPRFLIESGLGVRYIKRCRFILKCRQLMSITGELSEQDEERKQFISDNNSILEHVEIYPDKRSAIPRLLKCLNKNAVRYTKVYAKRRKHMPVFSAIVMLMLMLLTTGIDRIPQNPVYMEKYNGIVQKISRFVDEKSFYTTIKYVVAAPTAVYSKPETDSRVIYELSAGEPFCVISVDELNNKAYQVRFLTEDGFVKGWLINAHLEHYLPQNDPTVEKITPGVLNASSTDFGNVINLRDSTDYTVWAEGADGYGIGEYVEFVFEGAIPAKALMLQTGNCFTDRHYLNYGRPIGYVVQFYNGEECVRSVSITLRDDRAKQYFYVNKNIMADRVRFIIDKVAEGAVYEKACITGIEVYAEKTPGETGAAE